MTDLLQLIKTTLSVAPPPITRIEMPPYAIRQLDRMADQMTTYSFWQEIAEIYYPGAVRFECALAYLKDSEPYIEDVIAYDAEGLEVLYRCEPDEDGETYALEDLCGEWPVPMMLSKDKAQCDLRIVPKSWVQRDKMIDNLELIRSWLQSLPDSAFYSPPTDVGF